MSAIPDTSLGRRSIAEILLDHEYVTKEQVDEALALQAESGRPLGQILVEAGTITRLELASALAEQWSDSGAPISPPVGLSLSGTVPALEPFGAPVTPEPSAAHTDLVTRLDAVEEALQRLDEADDGDGQVELRAAVDAIAERVDALVVEDDSRDAPLQELLTAVNELQERLAATTQLAESALQRSDEVSTDAAAAVERTSEEIRASLRAELAAFAERMSVYAAGEDVERLREVVDALSQRPPRDAELVTQIEDLQEVVEELGARSTRDPDLVGQIEDMQAVVEALSERPSRDVELATQVDTLALRFSELGDRLDVLGAAVQSFAGDADALHELQGALAEIAQRPLADPAFERRLDDLTRMFDELAQQPVADPATERRLDDLARMLEELAQRPVADPATEARVEGLETTLEELRATTQALAERPVGDPALDEKLFDLTSRLAELERDDMLDDLRARIAELAERPTVDPSLIQRLGELEVKVDGLPGDEVLEKVESGERSLGYRIDGVMARVEEVEAALENTGESGVSREAWDEAVSVLNSRIEAERELSARMGGLEERVAEVAGLYAGSDNAAGADPKLAKQIAALSARVEQLAANGVPTAEAVDGSGEPVGPTAATLERDVEHVLMAIERLSVHLGAHERALTELMGSSGLVAQVRELNARVGDLETYGGGGGGSGDGGGDGDGGHMRAELRSLMRRLEDAETAQKKDRERVIEQLEKAAGAIDWRLQRLESVRADEPT